MGTNSEIPFEIAIVTEGESHRIVLSGDLSESSYIDFKYFKKQPESDCFVDLKKVNTVNSQGLAKIIRLLNTLVLADRKVYVDCCPETLVSTVASLPRLTKIEIRSFFSTLECTKCYSSDQVVVSIKDGVEKVPERFCSGCGERLVSMTSLDLGA